MAVDIFTKTLRMPAVGFATGLLCNTSLNIASQKVASALTFDTPELGVQIVQGFEEVRGLKVQVSGEERLFIFFVIVCPVPFFCPVAAHT